METLIACSLSDTFYGCLWGSYSFPSRTVHFEVAIAGRAHVTDLLFVSCLQHACKQCLLSVAWHWTFTFWNPSWFFTFASKLASDSFQHASNGRIPAWGHTEQHLPELNAQYVLHLSHDLTPQIVLMCKKIGFSWHVKPAQKYQPVKNRPLPVSKGMELWWSL